jgi:hypothetical protein
MLRPEMPPDPTDAIPSPEAVALRRAAHERERLARRRWSIAVSVTSLVFLATYLCLLLVVRVTEPFYLFVNLLTIMTGLCGFIVYLAYELPTILAELPRLSDRDRRINLAAIEPIRAELLGSALPSLGLTRSREEAAALDDDELVRRLAGLRRPDWRKIAPACFVAWLVVVSTAFVGIATYRPEYGVSLIERLQGQTPPIERSWSPLKQ